MLDTDWNCNMCRGWSGKDRSKCERASGKCKFMCASSQMVDEEEEKKKKTRVSFVRNKAHRRNDGQQVETF